MRVAPASIANASRSSRRAEPGARPAGPTANKSIENRVADRITAFAGSMPFVYIHIAWFSCWIGLGFEGYRTDC